MVDTGIAGIISLVLKLSIAVNIKVIVRRANIGNHSLQFAQFFLGVESFEPNPRTYDILKANTKNTININCHNQGCGQKNEELYLYEDHQNYDASRARKPYEKTKKPLKISIIKLDEKINQGMAIGLIKIDVEGMETQVLKGAQRIIKSSNPIILIEQNKDAFDINNRETSSIRFLRELDYSTYIFKGKENKNELPHRVLNILKNMFFSTSYEALLSKDIPKNDHDMIIAINNKKI